MKKNHTEELTQQTISYYNDYGLHVAAKINNLTAYELTQTLEKKYQVDAIKLSDGTRIWNLIRIYIYANLPESLKQKKTTGLSFSPFSLLKEGIAPLKIPKIHDPIYGFSSGASRKYYKNTFYDIYLDPFYDILGDHLVLFELPEHRGHHREYEDTLYSKHYVPFHIPLYSSAFWELLSYKLTSHTSFTIEHEEILKEIVEFISTIAHAEKEKINKDIYDFITVFFTLKKFFIKILKKRSPKAVLIRCGYGRFPMALAQACRELHIPSIELQHGIITTSHSAYIRTTTSDNHDCVPEYLLAYGDIFTDMVKKGNLFDKNRVISVGFPYLEKNRDERATLNDQFKKLTSSFQHTILITSQGVIAQEIQTFLSEIAEKLIKSGLHVGIILKPHPYDRTDYSPLKIHRNILLIDKYEDIYNILKIVDMHATVYSTSGLEAMAFGKPNIFIDLFGISDTVDSSFIVTSPTQFIETVKKILSNYNDLSQQTLEAAEIFFKPSSLKNIKNFFTELNLL